jgi:Leucine-rich repeat (LRR) protein
MTDRKNSGVAFWAAVAMLVVLVWYIASYEVLIEPQVYAWPYPMTVATYWLPGSGNVVITLDLENTDFTDADLKGVSSIGAVSDLVLSDCKGVTDARMKELANLNSLAQLWLGGTDVTDTGLKELGNLKKLTILSLTGCNTVTDVGVKELARLNNLTILDLSSTQVTDTGVKELAGLTTLSDLKLDDTQASSWINT